MHDINLYPFLMLFAWLCVGYIVDTRITIFLKHKSKYWYEETKIRNKIKVLVSDFFDWLIWPWHVSWWCKNKIKATLTKHLETTFRSKNLRARCVSITITCLWLPVFVYLFTSEEFSIILFVLAWMFSGFTMWWASAAIIGTETAKHAVRPNGEDSSSYVEHGEFACILGLFTVFLIVEATTAEHSIHGGKSESEKIIG
jgi:hypothetical protein